MPDLPEPPPTDVPPLDETSSFRQKSLALGEILHAVAESDPSGVPSPSAAAAFASWLAEAARSTHKPDYFADIRANYGVLDNTNKDLFDLFELLGQYVAVEDEEEPPKAFIGLPMLGNG